MGAGLWCVREEAVALGPQALHVRFDIVRTKADVVKAGPPLFQGSGNGALAVHGRHELYAGSRKRKESGLGLLARNRLGASECQAEIFGVAGNGLSEVSHADSDVVEMGNHATGRSLWRWSR